MSLVDSIPDKKQLQVHLGLEFEDLLPIMWKRVNRGRSKGRLAGPTACIVRKQTIDGTAPPPPVMCFLMGVSLSPHRAHSSGNLVFAGLHGPPGVSM